MQSFKTCFSSHKTFIPLTEAIYISSFSTVLKYNIFIASSLFFDSLDYSFI